MRKLTVFLLITLLCLMISVFYAKTSLAARKRVRKPREISQASLSRGVGVKVRFRSDRLGLLLNFSNFESIQSGTYELLYESKGITRSAGGMIILGDTSTKEVLFGSCSAWVCTFDENITNARLSVISKLKNGQTVLKPFRIKV